MRCLNVCKTLCQIFYKQAFRVVLTVVSSRFEWKQLSATFCYQASSTKTCIICVMCSLNMHEPAVDIVKWTVGSLYDPPSRHAPFTPYYYVLWVNFYATKFFISVQKFHSIRDNKCKLWLPCKLLYKKEKKE